MKSIFWFRQDLRLKDNPGLVAASKASVVIPIYILENTPSDRYAMGEASLCWLHHSLKSLNESLGGKLIFFSGDPLKILQGLIKSEKAEGVYWNRCYESWRIKRDKAIKAALKKEGVTVNSENSALLWEPWEIHKKDGTPYKVFTPFYRKGCLEFDLPREPLRAPTLHLSKAKKGGSLESLKLLSKMEWEKKIVKYWNVGEKGAHQQLKKFLGHGLEYYKEGRNFPARSHISRLSPHLHFGEISPHTVWHSIKGKGPNEDCFKSELGWREFSYYLLYHFPKLPEKNFQEKFDAFPWKKRPKHLKAWQKGNTGIPMVDAAMRELWETGYMHNRSRMIVGSFLVKNLLMHWKEGEAWFWDCLVDADLASNSASWQWVAGSGADAAPYFRIFNPVTQGEKFDPDGDYIRKFIPELKKLPIPYLYAPWTAPDEVLEKAGIELGADYPEPIVDLKESREEALTALKQVS